MCSYDVSKNEVTYIKKWRKRAMFTPHLKEMSRRCKYSVSDIQEDVVGFAKENAKSGIIYVLKDARTVVSDGEQCYSFSSFSTSTISLLILASIFFMSVNESFNIESFLILRVSIIS